MDGRVMDIGFDEFLWWWIIVRRLLSFSFSFRDTTGPVKSPREAATSEATS